MTTTRPADHIEDSLKLTADGEVVLWKIEPSGSTGTMYLKNDKSESWQGQLYTGVPIKISGEKKQSDAGLGKPRLVIGNNEVDISDFKPLIFDGGLDNATITKITVLHENFLADLDVKEEMIYRVKLVENYTSNQVTMLLATRSDSLDFSLPIRSYDQPDFQAVQLV